MYRQARKQFTGVIEEYSALKGEAQWTYVLNSILLGIHHYFGYISLIEIDIEFAPVILKFYQQFIPVF